MSSMTDYTERKLLGHIFRGEEFVMPDELWVALCTADPTDAATGSTLTEPSGSYGYARLQIDPSALNWSATSSTTGVTTNLVELVWTAAGGAWGTIGHWAICDSATAGNCLFKDVVQTSKNVGDGDGVTIPIGSMSMTFS